MLLHYYHSSLYSSNGYYAIFISGMKTLSIVYCKNIMEESSLKCLLEYTIYLLIDK